VSYRYPYSRLLLFAKAPILGQVKTRLIPKIGAALACQLHRYLIVTLLHRFTQAALVPVDIWYAGEDQDGFFRDCAQRFSLRLFQQQGRNLGDRMSQAIDVSLKSADSVMIVGADCISIQAEHIIRAFETVAQQDCVALHPAEDGGYVSIAMRRLHAEVFDNIDWGSDRVLSQTLSRAQRMSVPLRQLEMLWDLDRYEDLQRAGIDLTQIVNSHLPAIS